MKALVVPLIPRDGFTVRRCGERWELVNTRHYGRSVVLHSWPREQHSEAFEHCYRLNGRSAAAVRATARVR